MIMIKTKFRLDHDQHHFNFYHFSQVCSPPATRARVSANAAVAAAATDTPPSTQMHQRRHQCIVASVTHRRIQHTSRTPLPTCINHEHIDTSANAAARRLPHDESIVLLIR
jgi:hypothetical protein